VASPIGLLPESLFYSLPPYTRNDGHIWRCIMLHAEAGLPAFLSKSTGVLSFVHICATCDNRESPDFAHR
jgi:hypothetical protein